MGFLDWLREKPERSAGNELAREHGHPSLKSLWAEIRHDEKLAKVRDETGKEPESGSITEPQKKDREPDDRAAKTLPRTMPSWSRAAIRNEPENGPIENRHLSKAGNPIEIRSSGEWQHSYDGVSESRLHTGHSAEGWHGGLEVSRLGGEPFMRWSEGRQDQADADRQAVGMQEEWQEFGDEPDSKTKAGNRIVGIWANGWRSISPELVVNERVGRSDEGFHGGVALQLNKGDVETKWCAAKQSFDAARSDARNVRVERVKSIDRTPSKRQRGWER